MQNCTVYDKIPVSIEEVENKGRVDIIDANRVKWDYNDVLSIDNKFYGINKRDTIQIRPIALKPEYKAKVKMVDENGQIFIFKKIVSIDGKYYGLTRKDTTLIAGQVDQMKFYNKNNKKSRGKTLTAILVAAGVPVLIGFIIAVDDFANSFSIW